MHLLTESMLSVVCRRTCLISMFLIRQNTVKIGDKSRDLLASMLTSRYVCFHASSVHVDSFASYTPVVHPMDVHNFIQSIQSLISASTVCHPLTQVKLESTPYRFHNLIDLNRETTLKSTQWIEGIRGGKVFMDCAYLPANNRFPTW